MADTITDVGISGDYWTDVTAVTGVTEGEAFYVKNVSRYMAPASFAWLRISPSDPGVNVKNGRLLTTQNLKASTYLVQAGESKVWLRAVSSMGARVNLQPTAVGDTGGYKGPYIDPLAQNDEPEVEALGSYLFGDKTAAGEGGLLVSGSSIVSGDPDEHFELLSGRIVFTAAGASSASGSYELTMDDSSVIPIEVQSGYSVTTQDELNVVKLLDAATMSGESIFCRQENTFTIGTDTVTRWRNHTFTSVVTLRSDRSGTKANFNQVVLRNLTKVKLMDLHVHHTSNTNEHAVQMTTGTDDLEITNCRIHCSHFDPNGDYSSGNYANGRGISTSDEFTNLTITDCEIFDADRGIVCRVAAGGELRIIGNYIHSTFEDAITLSKLGVYNEVSWNTMLRPIALSSDSGNPHSDFLQVTAFPETEASRTLIVIGNIMAKGNARGFAQGIFSDDHNPGMFSTVIAKGNLIHSPANLVRAISVSSPENCVVIGNTVVSDSSSGNEPAVLFGNDKDLGVQVIKNNIFNRLIDESAGDTVVFDEDNNVLTTDSAAWYAGAFNGTDFSFAGNDSAEQLLATFENKPGGPAALANAGAVGSGYVDFENRTLDTSME